MPIQVWRMGLQTLTKMIRNHVRIILNRLGKRKNDRHEINSVGDQCVWS